MENTKKIDILVIEKITSLIYHICEINNIKCLIKKKKVKLPYYKYVNREASLLIDFYDREFDIPVIIVDLMETPIGSEIITDMMELYDFISNYFSYKKNMHNEMNTYNVDAALSPRHYAKVLKDAKEIFDKKLNILNNLNEKYT